MAPFFIFAGLLSVVCLFAWWRGGGPERAIALMFLIAWFLSVVTDSPDLMALEPLRIRYLGIELVYLGIDTLLFVGLLVVSRRANRVWPVAAASLQALLVLAHIARAINPHQVGFVYMVMTALWPILQLFLLTTGTALHWRRTATRGAEPSWLS